MPSRVVPNPILKVRELASDGDGKYVCPFCAGGATHEVSFSVTKENGLIKYNCFRATCKKAGIVRENPLNGQSPTPSTVTINDTVTKQRDKFLESPQLVPLPVAKRAYFEHVYAIEQKITQEWFWDKSSNSVVFPLRDMNGDVAGTQKKHYPMLDPKSNPASSTSSFNYWKSTHEGPRMHFAGVVEHAEELVLVEDILSATRLHKETGINAAALLGVHVTIADEQKLKKLGFNNIIICLDSDATDKAIRLKKQLELSFKSVVIVPLVGKDIKDMTTQEVEAIGFECWNRAVFNA